MLILSWDVGIINLAFCLIDFKDKDNYKIVDWNVINLTDRKKLNCLVCNKKASMMRCLNYKDEHYCKVHCKNLDEIKEFENYFELNLENSCCANVKDTVCNKKSKYQHQNKYYCNTHAKSMYKKMCNASKIKKITNKAVGAITIDVLRLKLIQELENRQNLLQADLVLIENQPTLKNPKMKAISSTIYDYYLIRGIFDKKITKSNIVLVKYMSPSNKLKLADDGDTKELIKLKGNEAKTYKLTKSLGIKYCLQMIDMYPEWIEFFKSNKKNDDLADAFLQGMYYAITNKSIKKLI